MQRCQSTTMCSGNVARILEMTMKHVTRLPALACIIALMSLTILPCHAGETESAMARGGRLYDKWWVENGTAKPEGMHPSYPIKGGKYADENSWRCKECHGWDYRGKDGAYAKGGHATGISGINGAADKNPAVIATLLRDKNHRYSESQLSAKDINDLALFVTQGQGSPAKYLSADNKSIGNLDKGEAYFKTICAGCHGADGTMIKIDDGMGLGSVAGNGAEMLHKLRNGQPGQGMPALRALDAQVTADLASYLTKLPQK